MTDIIANIVTIIIILIFCSSFLESYFDESKHISIRKYVMLEDNYYCSRNSSKKTKTPIKKHQAPPAKNKQPPKPKEDNSSLIRDCNSAMKSLKVPSNERKYLIAKIFNEHSPKTVQEFIALAFKK
jgi:hypothetical protein